MKTEFGKRLKKARFAAGYPSAQQFAYAINLEPHTYRYYERGDILPPAEALVTIAEKLNVSIDSLLVKKNLQAA